jgi:hypothetical protein
MKPTVRPARKPRTAAVVVPPVDTAAAAAVVVPDTAAAVVVPDPPTVPALPEPITLTVAGATVPDTFVMPRFVDAFVAGFRAVARMPSVTRDERIAVADVFRAECVRVMGDMPVPMGRHTGRFSGQPVFESQNTLYVAAVLANVATNGGHIMAAWRVELPNAKCDYLAKNYAWSTMSEFLNGNHNGTVIPDGNIVVRLWANRNRQSLTA